MNRFKNITSLRHWLFIAAICTAFTACNKDEEAEPVSDNSIDISDPNAVAAGLTIRGASVVQGNPPAPSTDPNAPSLYSSGNAEQKAAILGESFSLDVTPEYTEDVAGVYLKVKGSDSYFNIPASSLSQNGRIAFSDGQRIGGKQARKGIAFVQGKKLDYQSYLQIDIPDNLQPGTFCAEYCVYDSQNRVSNIVEVCVEVVAFGGENSSFLTDNGWTMVYNSYNYDGGEVEVDSVGVNDYYNFFMEFPCADGSWQELEAENVFRTDYVHLNMSANGGLLIDEKYYEKWVDYDNSNCENGIAYEEIEEAYTLNGAWSYNDATKDLILVINYEEVDYTETDAVKFKVETSGDLLYLRFSDADGSSVAVFKKW